MAREEPAPGVVGGLLVSCRLEGELKGASSTEGGMANGCEGSVMEPCTGASLGALGRPAGDEVLAPRGFAMADSEKVARGVRAAWGQMEVLWKWCSGLAPIAHQMEVFARQMVGLK